MACVPPEGAGDQDANARRLVACWNACVGIPTEILESEKYIGTASFKMRSQAEAQRDHFQSLAKDNGQVIIKTACELADVKTQRDALLAALQHIQRCIPIGGFAQIHHGSSTWEQIDAAITQATGVNS